MKNSLVMATLKAWFTAKRLKKSQANFFDLRSIEGVFLLRSVLETRFEYEYASIGLGARVYGSTYVHGAKDRLWAFLKKEMACHGERVLRKKYGVGREGFVWVCNPSKFVTWAREEIKSGGQLWLEAKADVMSKGTFLFMDELAGVIR